jgi:Ran-binding protein 1
MPYLKLQENKSSDKSWIWSCPADFAEEKPTEEVFAIRFANVDGSFAYQSAHTYCGMIY